MTIFSKNSSKNEGFIDEMSVGIVMLILSYIGSTESIFDLFLTSIPRGRVVNTLAPSVLKSCKLMLYVILSICLFVCVVKFNQNPC